MEQEYLPWKWQAGVTNEGKMIAFPMDTGPTALFYRADLFEQAGFPSNPATVASQMKSWDTYLAAGTQFQQAMPGVKWSSESVGLYSSVRRQSADLYVSREDQYIGNGPATRNAWDIAVKAAKAGLLGNVAAFAPDWNAAMAQGKVATFPGAVWLKQLLMEAAPETAGLWRVAAMPGGAGNQGGSFLGVTKASRKKELAFQLIKFVQSPAAQLKAYTSLSLYPAAISSISNPEANLPEPFFGDQNTNEVFGSQALEVPSFYFSPADNVINPILQLELSNAVLQGKDSEQAWNDAQSQIEREVKHKMPWVKWDGN